MRSAREPGAGSVALRGPSLALGVALSLAAIGAACGTRTTSGSSLATGASSSVTAPAMKPTVRIYVTTTLAGALEPCGCSKDQLGGVSHFAAYLASQKDAASGTLLVGAGPFFFMDPALDPDKRSQDEWKADALAAVSPSVGLTAWAPGANDWADGKDALAQRIATTKAAFLGANLQGQDGITGSKIVDAGGISIGIVGVADPGSGAKAPDGVTVASPADALKREVTALRSKGARAIVALAAVSRGDALRLVDAVPDVDVLVVGKPIEHGDTNDKQKPAVLVGKTLVVETSNHLQTTAVVDLFVDPAAPAGPLSFADAGGVAKAEELVSVSERIRDLENRINGWEKSKSVNAADLEARRHDLGDLRAQKAKLEEPAPPPTSGSYFRYDVVEVREAFGTDEAAKSVALGYYKRVDDHNKEAFKGRMPEPAEKGMASYVGVDECSRCHTSERAVWDKTDHAKAYPTLQKEFVEYNLDCVGCHVTGYDKPGGSTVTHVEKLENVGCEECHGPGSLHIADPKKDGLIVKKPDLKRCVTECHHPPHVEGFDATVKVENILGPGHGR